MQLNFDIDGFLRDHWQKKPRLIRNAWTRWANPLEPDELAGLACEEDVESRLIVATGVGPEALKVEAGPIPQARFGKLGKRPWTLLVNAVDHHVPEVAALIAPFRFVPDWRIDDVMVSYATEGGGVGPHFDQYDVFLVQGLGKRRWQIGAMCDGASELLPHDDLRLLANFKATDEWVLEPGDILYVPPGLAHNGIGASDDCMTYSVGFRAPARSELIAHYVDDALGRLADDDRYADPDLRRLDNPGEIPAEALDRLHAMVTETLGDRDAFVRWFGGYVSTPKYPEVDWAPEEAIEVGALRGMLADGVALVRNPASRFSFVRQGGSDVLLFVDGECFECRGETAAFAERLCAGDRVEIAPRLSGSDAALALIGTLLSQGSIAFED
ncbi:MAG: cupin domain-containing protein [Sphingobium sp.]|nr:cupin domain-containing protein [Sphingobium sp.]